MLFRRTPLASSYPVIYRGLGIIYLTYCLGRNRATLSSVATTKSVAYHKNPTYRLGKGRDFNIRNVYVNSEVWTVEGINTKTLRTRDVTVE
jgi:hypothetical protein